MTSERPAPGTVRPRGRTERVRLAVLAATRAELEAHGYADLTVERIADKAGVAKTTVYRRWRDIPGLLAEMLRESTAADVPMPDTGSIEQDLRELALQISRLYANPVSRATILGLIASGVNDPKAADLMRDFFRHRVRRAAGLVERAIARGELPADTDSIEIIRMVGAPFYYRMLVTHEPIDDAVAEQAAAAALAAARSGACRTPGSRPAAN